MNVLENRFKIMAMISTALMLSTCQPAGCDLHPVILVPGNGGNQLEARLGQDYEPTSLWCTRSLYPIFKKKNGWFRLWFDPTVLLAPFTRCFNDRMMLYYDPDVDDYHNAPGVDTRVLDFGSTKSLLCLNPYLKTLTSYMAPLVESLEKAGYVNDKTILGSPYDFRYGLAANGHSSHVGSKFLQDLKHLIETTSLKNQGKPVILLSHSLGGLFVLQLLNRPPSWRQKYIKHFISLSTPWGGTVEQMKTFASGNTLGVPLVDPLLVRPQQRSSESNQWLLPSRRIFNDRNQPLVVTSRANYSAYDMNQFLRDIGFPEGVGPYNTRVLPLTEDLPAPGVPVTCIYGRDVETPEVLVYGKGGFDEQPEIQYGDGDGTVNLASLSALQLLWMNEKNQSLKNVEIKGVSHQAILKDEVALEEILRVITAINSS